MSEPCVMPTRSPALDVLPAVVYDPRAATGRPRK